MRLNSYYLHRSTSVFLVKTPTPDVAIRVLFVAFLHFTFPWPFLFGSYIITYIIYISMLSWWTKFHPDNSYVKGWLWSGGQVGILCLALSRLKRGCGGQCLPQRIVGLTKSVPYANAGCWLTTYWSRYKIHLKCAFSIIRGLFSTPPLDLIYAIRTERVT